MYLIFKEIYRGWGQGQHWASQQGKQRTSLLSQGQLGKGLLRVAGGEAEGARWGLRWIQGLGKGGKLDEDRRCVQTWSAQWWGGGTRCWGRYVWLYGVSLFLSPSFPTLLFLPTACSLRHGVVTWRGRAVTCSCLCSGWGCKWRWQWSLLLWGYLKHPLAACAGKRPLARSQKNRIDAKWVDLPAQAALYFLCIVLWMRL